MEVKLVTQYDVKETNQTCIQTIGNNIYVISSHNDYVSMMDFINPPILIKTSKNYILCKDNQQNVYLLEKESSIIYVLQQQQLQEFRKVNCNGQQIIFFGCVTDDVYIVTTTHIINVTKEQETQARALQVTVSSGKIIYEGDDGALHTYKDGQISNLPGSSLDGIRHISGLENSDLLFLSTYNAIYLQNAAGERALIYQAGDYSEIFQLTAYQIVSSGQIRFSVVIDGKLLIFGVLSGNSARVLAELDDVQFFWPASSIADIHSHGVALRRDQGTLTLIRASDQAQNTDLEEKLKQLKQQIETLQQKLQKTQESANKMVPRPSIVPACGDGQAPHFLFRIDGLDTGNQVMIQLPANAALLPQSVPSECLVSKNCIYIQNSAGPLEFDLYPTPAYDDGVGCTVIVYQSEQQPAELTIQPMAFFRAVPRMPDGIIPFVTIEIPENITDKKDQNPGICNSYCLLGPGTYVAVSDINPRHIKAGSISALLSYIQVRYSDLLSDVSDYPTVEEVCEKIQPKFSVQGLFSRLQVYVRAFSGSQISIDFGYQASLLMADLKLLLQSLNIDYITNKFKVMDAIKLISSKLDGSSRIGLEIIRQIFVDAGIVI